MQNNGENITARVFKMESLNTHNGPGYRTVIYLKGCPLSCQWCHNPEGISAQKEIWVSHKKCIACLTCVQSCPVSALSFVNSRIEVDREKCDGCYICAGVCPSKAIEKIGKDMTVSEVFGRILKDKPFLEASAGGVTVTGGEPGTAPEFVSRLFQRCREHGIHTAFDTSGFVSRKALSRIIPHTDLVFFDLKVMDETRAQKFTGQGTSLIFESLEWIKSYIMANRQPQIQFRTPVIPGMTDSKENMTAIARKIRSNFSGMDVSWEMNLFNDICEDKYQRMNKKWVFNGVRFTEDDFDLLETFAEKNQDINITIAGFIQKQKEQ